MKAESEIEPEGEDKPGDGNVLSDEFAAMSISQTNNSAFDLCALSSVATIYQDIPLALASLSSSFNSALDSACTNHIIRDHTFFHRYDPDGGVPVKTANCRFLETVAVGDVKFNLRLSNGHTVIWTLRNCLHAPTVPINLISIGALQEHHLSVNFSYQKTTVSFPTDATRDMLSLDFATGITPPASSSNVHIKCIPCLIGKSAQTPYQHNGNRASEVCELIHIDTCGPFPTLTPKKEQYFTIFLDDAANFGHTKLLVAKSDSFLAYKKIEASWELKSGNRVKSIRFDGAKEFTQGPFAKHLASRGIAVQVTAPYAHSQAGKAERYIRTIEDGIQTLIADAKLPPSFWGDAALTYQYL